MQLKAMPNLQRRQRRPTEPSTARPPWCSCLIRPGVGSCQSVLKSMDHIACKLHVSASIVPRPTQGRCSGITCIKDIRHRWTDARFD